MKNKIFITIIFILFFVYNLFPQNQLEIAKKLSNPLGYLSFPFQSNFDVNVTPNSAFRWTMYMMPIVPFSINKKFNSLNRIVLPVIYQKDIYKGTTQTGVGDLLINAFISPKSDDIVYGVGPTVYIPTGTPLQLTARKWAAGPGMVAMNSFGRLKLGALLFHMWSVAGDNARPDFSFTYFQPVSLYNFKDGWGIGLSAEISNEWKKKVTNGSVILQCSKLFNFSGQLINFVFGQKIFFGNFNRPEIGSRFSVNLLFP